MSFINIIGMVLLASPFVVIAIGLSNILGWREVLGIFSVAFVVPASVVLGVCLALYGN